MASGGSIKYNIGFNVDKTGLNQLKTSLKEIQMMTEKDMLKIDGGKNVAELNKIKQTASEVEKAFNQAFNQDLGTLNVTKFKQTIDSTAGGISNIKAQFALAGTAGQTAFRNLTTQVLTSNLKLKETSSLLTNMATTMANTIKWGVASSVMNTFTGTVQKAYGYVKNLDGSLNDIRIVTGKSAEEMDKFAVKANNAAKALGQTTTNYTDAALIYYQQGLSDQEAAARAEVTLKTANVTGQTGAEVSEQLTAVWNGYKVNAEEAELYIDKLAAVAATTASDLEELSTGMSKVASAANTMGVDVDQLNAQLSTIVSVTRQAPESVGTALKTIYARMSDLKLGGTDEDGLGLGDVSGTMESMGIDVMDATGNLRDMGEVIEDVAAKWGTWTEAQKTAMAQVMAGKRQYNNLMALFENWDMYEQAKATSENSAGTLQKQQDTYMESTEAHLKTLKAEWEDLYDSLLDADSINDIADLFSNLLSITSNFVDAIGGGKGVLLALGSVAMNVFSKQMAQGITRVITNFKNMKYNAQQVQNQLQFIRELMNDPGTDAGTQNVLKMKQQLLEFGSALTKEQQQEANAMIEARTQLENQNAEWEEKKQHADEYLQKLKESKNFKDGIGLADADLKTTNMKISKNKDGEIVGEDAEAFKNIQTQAKATQSVLKGLSGDLKITKNSVNDLYAAYASGTASTQQYEAVTEELNQIFDKLSAEIDMTQGEGKELEQVMRHLNQAMVFNAPDHQKYRAVKDALDALSNTADLTEDQIKQLLFVMDKEASGASAHFASAAEQAEQQWNKFVNNSQTLQIVDQSLKIVGGIGQIASGLTSLMNITNILENDSLSAGEKTLQVISALAMALPMLWGGFGNVYQSVIKAGTALAAKTAATTADIAATTTATAAEGAKAGADTVATGTTLTFAGAMGTLAGAIWAALAPLLPFIAATAALGIAIYAVEKHERAAEDAMNKANEALEEQQKLTAKTREEFDNLKSSLEDYGNARKEIDDMVQGTLEWNEAVQSLNQSVLDLMQTYPELAQYVTRSEQGILEISEKGQEALVEQSLKKVRAMQTSSAILQADAAEKTKIYESQQLSQKIKGYNTTSKKLTQAEAVGTGYHAGDVVSSTVTASLSQSQMQDLVEAVNQDNSLLGDKEALTDFIYGQGSSFKTLTVEQQKLIEALMTNSSELISLGEKFENLDIASEMAQNEAIIGSIANLGYDSFNNTNSATQLAIAKQYSDEIAAETEANKSNYSGLGTEDLGRQYAEQNGIAGYGQIREENGFLIYEAADGTEVGRILKTTAINTLAQQEATQEILTEEVVNASVTAIDTMQENANKVVEGSGQFLATFAGGEQGSFVGASGSQMKDIESLINSSYFAEQNYEAYGYKSADAMREAVNHAIEQYWETYNGFVEAETLKNSALKTSDLQGALSSGENLDEEQQAHLNNLEQKYKDLGEIQDKNSHEYLKRLREIIELEEDEAKQALEIQREKDEKDAEAYANKIARYEQLKNMGSARTDEEDAELAEMELTIEADVTAFEETMDNLQDYYKEMKILIDADLKTDVDEAFGLAEEFGKLQDMVADDLTITFEEAQNLINQGYGEILQNAQETSEQTILLDKATMNAFIDSRQKELEEDKKAKIGQLESQRIILVSQKEALAAKLTALETALNAEDETQAAAALAEVARQEGLYQTEVAKMGKLLEEEAENATKQENIDADLYNSLGGMYDQDSENQQNAEQIATNQQKREIDIRIANVKALHNAYKQLSEAVRASATGGDVGDFDSGETSGSSGIDDVTHTDMTKQEDFTQEAPTIDDLDLSKYFTEETPGGNAEYKNTIKEMINQTKSEINGIDDQIGAIDAGIAALNSSSTSLDTSQNNAQVGGSKGGGGSSKDKKEKEEKTDQMELLTEEIDAYHDVNNRIEKINKELEKQERITSKLAGKDRIKSLDKELEIIEKQKKAEEDKLNILRNEANTLKDKLSKSGVAFDGEDITNYEDILAKKLSEVNQVIAKYNSAQTKAEQEALKAEVDAAKASYEQFKKDIERYEDLVINEIEDSEQAIREAFDKQIEIQIEQFELELQLKIDAKDAERQLNEFNRKYVEGIKDDEYDKIAEFNLKQIDTYTSADGDLYNKEQAMNKALDAYKTIQAGGTDSVYGDDAAKALEAYEKYRDEVMDVYGDIDALIEEVNQAQLDGIKAANEEFDKQLEKYDQLEDAINRRIKMAELLNGEEDYESQLKYQEQLIDINKERQDTLKTEIETYREQLAVMEANGQANSEAAEELAENLREAEEELAETTANSLELIAEKYEMAKKKLIADTDKAMTGGQGLDAIKKEWERINDEADMYLDSVNSAYEISQLESKFRDAIDNTDSVYAQERLNALMDKELGKLREKDKLTQYEVDRANKLLDIELKKIALEEAQSSKTQMRLRRDSQGNYTYQYVSDQSKVEEAQRALEEAENELYNMDKDAYKKNLEEIQDAYADYLDEVEELQILYKDNTAKFYEELAKLNEHYNNKIGGLTEQNKEISFNLQGSTLSMVAKYSGMDEDELKNLPQEEIDKIMAEKIPQWTSGTAALVAQLSEGGFGEMAEMLMESLLQMKDDQAKEMEDAANNGGENLEEIANGADIVTEKFKGIKAETAEIANSFGDMLTTLSDNAAAAADLAENLKEAAEHSSKIIKEGNALVYSGEEGAGNDGSVPGYESSTKTDKSSNNKQPSTKTNKESETNSPKTMNAGMAEIDSYAVTKDRVESYMGAVDSAQSETAYKTEALANNYNSMDSNFLSNDYLQNSDANYLQATHEAFTSAFLDNSFTDSLAQTLDASKFANVVEMQLEGILAKLDKLVAENGHDILEQIIHVTADFPNATNIEEIKEAFKQLPMLMSQYAYR